MRKATKKTLIVMAVGLLTAAVGCAGSAEHTEEEEQAMGAAAAHSAKDDQASADASAKPGGEEAAAAKTEGQADKRVLFVMTNHAELGDTGKKTGYYLSEVSHPYHVFTEAGFTVDFVSPTGGAAPMDPKSEDRSDPINAAFLDDAEVMGRLEDTLAPSEVDANDYAAVYYPGGHGTMWDLAETPKLAKTSAAIYEAGGVVGAVCHGPVGLVNIELSDGSYLVAGKKVAAFTNVEERAVELEDVVPFLLQDKLAERGAKVVEGEKFKENVVVDERLVTGQNPASAKAAAEAMVDVIQ